MATPDTTPAMPSENTKSAMSAGGPSTMAIGTKITVPMAPAMPLSS